MSDEKPSAAWSSEDFEGDLDDRAKAMLDEAIAVDQQQQTGFDLERDLDLMRMYEQRPVTDLLPYTGAFLSSHGPALGTSAPAEVSPWNVLRAVINTAHAMLARSKIRGRFLTSNGTQDQKRRAKAATQWLDGWSAEAKLHEVCGQCLRDAEVCRFGVAAIEERDDKVVLERVLPGEIRYDYMSARNGKPKTIFRQRPMSKGVLLAKFGKGNPKARAAIITADTIPTESGGKTDMVLVREAYSVPSTKTSNDGWHGIVIESQAGARLLMEPWTKPWHPYVFFIWEAWMMGLGGTSLAAYLEPMQTELNHMLWVERKARKLFGRPHLWLDAATKMAENTITNDVGSIWKGGGKPPVPLVWDYMPAQHFASKRELIQNMYAFAGISQNASEGNKAPGAESGVAQREAMESQNLRLQVYAQTSWENPHVEIMNRAVEMAADIAKDTGSYEVEAETQHGVEVVDFVKVMKDLKAKKVTIYPTGFLPLTPAARLDFILKMLESQLWDVDRARAAMSDLDVDSEDTLENSIQRMFSTAFENMLYDGKAEHPDELAVGNYNVAIKTAAVYLAMAKIEKCDPKNISLARRYVDELRSLKLRAEGKQGPTIQQPIAPTQPAPGPAQPVPPVGEGMQQAVANGAAPPPMPS